MSYFEILPKNQEAEALMVQNRNALFQLLEGCASKAFGIPAYDIICELNECRVITFSESNQKMKAAPDVLIKISTNDVELKDKAEYLKDLVIDGWNTLFGKKVALECWIDFFHTWGCNIDFDS